MVARPKGEHGRLGTQMQHWQRGRGGSTSDRTLDADAGNRRRGAAYDQSSPAGGRPDRSMPLPLIFKIVDAILVQVAATAHREAGAIHKGGLHDT